MENNFKFEDVHISDINVGDAIMCFDGKVRTVCKKDIKYDSFDGISIFGYTWNLGYKKVKKLIPRF